MAASTVRDANKDLSVTTPRTLLHSALTGTPLPYGLLYQAVKRNRAERKVTQPRAALIKLVLLSHQPDMTEDAMVQLDPNYPDPAYHCGRLLAVLEEIQEAAIPNINTTIADKNFASASATPAVVLGRLLAGAKPHLTKLRRDKEGAYYALQDRLDSVLGVLQPNMPRLLGLVEQSLFAIGYYHQRAFDRAQKRKATANKVRAGIAAAQASSGTAAGDLWWTPVSRQRGGGQNAKR